MLRTPLNSSCLPPAHASPSLLLDSHTLASLLSDSELDLALLKVLLGSSWSDLLVTLLLVAIVCRRLAETVGELLLDDEDKDDDSDNASSSDIDAIGCRSALARLTDLNDNASSSDIDASDVDAIGCRSAHARLTDLKSGWGLSIRRRLRQALKLKILLEPYFGPRRSREREGGGTAVASDELRQPPTNRRTDGRTDKT
ncbi:hypothetical protein GUITHDRAFT_147195 [Guillardia theta CCMP2712]|uniref:Uncharacterized protein n=1 Tax=Guillardia theta (strain CCMP2712) TaxID=905079 RepID=L1IE44_GUITC|nr:hypothetical protein GUITHDRAFT_147195 [Guillardia theta CCMP2712]EKX34498.1 hypothetical protein GUITHDRAFT_147195 [Guillardia theta CCMP2712]|eukprot:XP_005821478.1 hypothetical protein GUITHDRAFT_147195 [Guillardia theta CCMP2712]